MSEKKKQERGGGEGRERFGGRPLPHSCAFTPARDLMKSADLDSAGPQWDLGLQISPSSQATLAAGPKPTI